MRYSNTSGFGKSKVADGGRGIQYQTDNILEIQYIKPWVSGGKQIGQMIHWKVKTSAAGGFPGSEAQGWLKYGIGIGDSLCSDHEMIPRPGINSNMSLPR